MAFNNALVSKFYSVRDLCAVCRVYTSEHICI